MRFLVIFLLLISVQAQAEEIARLITDMGTIGIKLNRQQRPLTVSHFVGLVNGTTKYTKMNGERVKGVPYYDGQIFYRTHPELGIFTGCPIGNGTGWPGIVQQDEKASESVFDRKGLVAMAKPPGSQLYGSQFFITSRPLHHLNGKYTIFGEVVAGMEVVEKIANAKTDITMKPLQPIHMKSIEISHQ